MYLKASLASQSVGKQLFVLLLLVLAGSIFSSLIGLSLFWLIYGFQAQMTSYPDAMRLLQFLSACGTFLFPAFGTAYLCSYNYKEFLSLRSLKQARPYLLVVVSIFLISPAIGVTALLNEQMQFPEWMKPIEDWMRQQEDNGAKLTNLLIYGGGFLPLASNLIVIALTAGITEELLFRGTLCRILSRFPLNHHAAIWIAAILFSAFHLQFYGFIPRMLLGAYFGYLLYWSRCIWLPVLAHFTNNAIAVLGMSVPSLRNNEFITGEVSEPNLVPYIILSLVFLGLFYLFIKRLKMLLAEEFKE